MFKFQTLRCHNCGSVILNLPEDEVNRLDGLNFQCETCGHDNRLHNHRFVKSREFSMESEAISVFQMEI